MNFFQFLTEVFFSPRIICTVRLRKRTYPRFFSWLAVGNGSRYALWALGILLFSMTPLLAEAAKPDQVREYEFNIPQQDVESALNKLATKAGVLLLFPYDQVQPVYSNPVVGKYTVEEALNVLLQGTELTGGLTEGGVITISRLSSVEPNEEGKNMKTKKQTSLVAAILSIFGTSSGASAAAIQNNESVGLAIEEVVVTAQKRAANLQDTNISITAITGDRIADARIGDIEDLQAFIPGITAGNDFGQAKFFFRGLGLNSSFAAVDPSVALHVDGAVVARAEGQLGVFFDLERVEALRGPQGTLYGRNATGGSLNLISKKPTEELEGYGRLTLGNESLMSFEGAVGGPITDKVQARIAYKSTDRDGYGINEFSGEDVDDAHKQAFRGSLRFIPNDNLELTLIAEYTAEDDRGLPLNFAGETFPDGTAPTPPGRGGYATKRRNVSSETEMVNDRDNFSFTALVDYQISENMTLKSITNYRELDVLWVFDNDYASHFNDDVVHLGINSEQHSQELQLNYDTEDMRLVFGAYYFQEDLALDEFGGCNSPVDNVLSTNCNFNGSVPFVFGAVGRQDIESYAAFANISYDLSDSLSVNAGVRYSKETRDALNTVLFDFPDFGFTAFTVGNSFADPLSVDADYDDVSPSIGMEWSPNDDTLVFLTYSQAFKSGAILAAFGTEFVDPEEVENIELGLKTTLLDNRLRLNVAVFKYTAENMQFDASVPQAGGAFGNVFKNAAEQEGEGIEVEATWLASQELTLSGFVSWSDIEFEEFFSDDPSVDFFGTELQDLSGNSPRKTPEVTASLRGEYDIALNNGGVFTLGAEASYKSEQFFTEFNRKALSQESYTLVDLNLKYTSPSEQFTVNIWGKNITDETVRSSMFAVAAGRVLSEALLPPVTYGVTFGYNF